MICLLTHSGHVHVHINYLQYGYFQVKYMHNVNLRSRVYALPLQINAAECTTTFTYICKLIFISHRDRNMIAHKFLHNADICKLQKYNVGSFNL